MIEAARENTNAAFDFASQLMTVKSLSEVVELSTAHTRKQFEALTAQTKELAAIAQKVATETVEPVKESFGKVFRRSPELAAASARDAAASRPGPTARAFCSLERRGGIVATKDSRRAGPCQSRTCS